MELIIKSDFPQWNYFFVIMSNSSPLNDKIPSLVASQSVTSLRPLNRQIAKSHLSVQ